MRLLADDDRGVEILVQSFETRREIHWIADNGEFNLLASTNIPEDHIAGVDADAD